MDHNPEGVPSVPQLKAVQTADWGPVTTRMASSDYRREVYSLVLGGEEGGGGR